MPIECQLGRPHSAGLRHCGFLTCPIPQGTLRDAASLCVLALPPAALDQP